MRVWRLVLLGGGALGLLALVFHLGAGSIAAALSRVPWWAFLTICVLYGASLGVDALAWQWTIPRRSMPFPQLLAARCASEAVGALTILPVVGAEGIKAWLLRYRLPYDDSIPSLILAKSAEVVGQTLLLVVGVLVAWVAGVVGSPLFLAMGSWLLIQGLAVGGFLAVQMAGLVGKAGRLLSWAGGARIIHAQQLDDTLRRFYRADWQRFLLSCGLQFAGGLLGVVEALLILRSLDLPASLVTATVVDVLWSAVRFATFFVPANLGPLEGAGAGVFQLLGFGASAGLAFTLIRRARQVVWIGLGVIVLVSVRPIGTRPEEGGAPVPSGAD